MSKWLLSRLFAIKDQPTPRFAFQGTMNWMGALALLVNSSKFSDKKIKSIYSEVNRRNPNIEADTIVFENMLMAVHNLASLEALNKEISHKYDICRIAIISWYYATYFGVSAMVAASSGSKQETHTSTAKVFHTDIVTKELLPYPFNLHLDSLVGDDVKSKIKSYRSDNPYDLKNYPRTVEQAHGGCISYLKGTANYRKWEIEERIRKSKSFRNLEVENFKTKKAKNILNEKLRTEQVNYLHEAFRYRGKANYRDSIFLTYGDNNEHKIISFVNDLKDVTTAFIKVVSIYASKRVKRGDWDLFNNDLSKNSRLSIKNNVMRV